MTPVASVSAGPPLGGLYLKPPSRGGLCDGVTTMPSARSPVAAAVERQDRVADRGRRGVAIGRIDHRDNVIGGQHLQRRRPCRFRQRVGVAADEQRARGALRRPVLDDGLRGGQDVRLVERRIQARPAVPGRTERHLLIDVVRVGFDGVVGRHHLGHIDEVFGLRRLCRHVGWQP